MRKKLTLPRHGEQDVYKNFVTNSEIEDPSSAEKSLATQRRIRAIQTAIQAHEGQIAYFQAIVERRIDLSKQGCTPEIRYYQPTPEDNDRLPKTLENLRQQIRLLQHEQEVLNTYGR